MEQSGYHLQSVCNALSHAIKLGAAAAQARANAVVAGRWRDEIDWHGSTDLDPTGALAAHNAVFLGLGHIVALHYCSSTLYQIH